MKYFAFLLVGLISVCSCEQAFIEEKNLKSETTNARNNLFRNELIIIFNQDFNQSTVISDYVSATPDLHQLTNIANNEGNSVATITNQKLKLSRSGTDKAYFSRTADFISDPAVVKLEFDLSVSGNSISQNNAVQIQIGSNFTDSVSNAGTPIEPEANVFARLGISFSANNGIFFIRNISASTNSKWFSGEQSVSWMVNNSEETIAYIGPNGETDLLSPKRGDIWVGSEKIFDEVSPVKGNQKIRNFKLSFTQGNGAITIDNLKVSDLSYLSDNPAEPILLFNNGFEGTSGIVHIGSGSVGDQLIGADNTIPSPNDWSVFMDSIFPGPANIYYEGGDDMMRYAKIVNDPFDANNKVLEFWMNHPNVSGASKGRIQMDAYNGSGLKEIYQSVRVLLDRDIELLKGWNVKFSQFTLFELWNNKVWNSAPEAFRISLNIAKTNPLHNTGLYFKISSEKYNGSAYSPVWADTAINYQIPFGKWATFEYYIKEGGEQDGRFYFAVTPDGESKTVVFDIRNYTKSPDAIKPDGITDINPLKLYTNSGVINHLRETHHRPIKIYWDDVKVWKDKRP